MKVLGVSWSDQIGSRWNGVSIRPLLSDFDIQYNLLTGSIPRLTENWIKPCFPGKTEDSSAHHLINAIEARSGLQSRLFYWTNRLFEHEFYKQCDIVHLHIIHNGWFRLEAVERIAREKKVIWSLHDPWISTGHCIYPYDCDRWSSGCGNCPDLGRPLAVTRDRTDKEVLRKKQIIDAIDATYLVSTQWFSDHLVKSGFDSKRIKLLPFGIDGRVFSLDHKKRKEFRKRHLIEENQFVLALRVSTEPQKGLSTAIRALSQLDVPITILALDQYDKLRELKGKHRILEFGWIDDEEELANIYRCADVFLMPSIAETFGFMSLEAMSCGTPVVYDRKTAIHEVVDAPIDFTFDIFSLQGSLEKKLSGLIKNRRTLIKESLRVAQRAQKEFSIELYASRTAETYEKIMKDQTK